MKKYIAVGAAAVMVLGASPAIAYEKPQPTVKVSGTKATFNIDREYEGTVEYSVKSKGRTVATGRSARLSPGKYRVVAKGTEGSNTSWKFPDIYLDEAEMRYRFKCSYKKENQTIVREERVSYQRKGGTRLRTPEELPLHGLLPVQCFADGSMRVAKLRAVKSWSGVV